MAPIQLPAGGLTSVREQRSFSDGALVDKSQVGRNQDNSRTLFKSASSLNGDAFKNCCLLQNQEIGVKIPARNVLISDRALSDQASIERAIDRHGQKPRTARSLGFSYRLAGDFFSQQGEDAGGATGSKRVKVGGMNFQLKRSVLYGKLKEKIINRWLDVQNCAEVIGSSIAKAIFSKAAPKVVHGMDRFEAAPEVTLLHDKERHEMAVASRYLAEGQGSLDDYFKNQLGGTLGKGRGRNHVHIVLDNVASSESQLKNMGKGKILLEGAAARDVLRQIAMRALLDDHDANAGNLVVVQRKITKDDVQQDEIKRESEPRIGSIDFAHSFSNLVNGFGGRWAGGGGVKPGENRVLDFFNRETVRGNPFSRHSGHSKVWRDFSGAVPSTEMAAALREVARNGEYIQGLAQAKAKFLSLIGDLRVEDTPAANREINDMVKALKQISSHIGAPITTDVPEQVLTALVDNIKGFIDAGRRDMEYAADLCELQAKIDTHLLTKDKPGGAQVTQSELAKTYQQFRDKHYAGKMPKDGIAWLKFSRGVPAFKGTLEQYINHRERYTENPLAALTR